VSYDVDFALSGTGNADKFIGPFGAQALGTACLDYSPKVTGLIVAPSVNPESISTTSSTTTTNMATNTNPASSTSMHSGADGKRRAVPMIGCLLIIAMIAVVAG
jgi:hypothetical protein